MIRLEPAHSSRRFALALGTLRLKRQTVAERGLLAIERVTYQRGEPSMDFKIPKELQDYLDELDQFIEKEIMPIQNRDDNIRFFDHRREHARTDWDNGGLPRAEWEALLAEARQKADAAGHLRFAWPNEYGGKGGSNLWMAVIREHLASKGLGLFNDLQTEH